MEKIYILALLDNGAIKTSNGTIKFGMSLIELRQILGDLKYAGDYQDNEFFKCNTYLCFDSHLIDCYLNLNNKILNVIQFSLIDREGENNKQYKAHTILFLNGLSEGKGKIEKGKKYLKRLVNAYINLGNSNSKKPFVLIRFYLDE